MSGTYGYFQWCGKVVNGMFRGREVGFDDSIRWRCIEGGDGCQGGVVAIGWVV